MDSKFKATANHTKDASTPQVSPQRKDVQPKSESHSFVSNQRSDFIILACFAYL